MSRISEVLPARIGPSRVSNVPGSTARLNGYRMRSAPAVTFHLVEHETQALRTIRPRLFPPPTVEPKTLNRNGRCPEEEQPVPIQLAITTRSLFPTPVAAVLTPDAEARNAELLPLIRQRRATAPSMSASNAGGWHSARDLLAWGGVRAAEVVEMARAVATHMTRDRDGERGAAGVGRDRVGQRERPRRQQLQPLPPRRVLVRHVLRGRRRRAGRPGARRRVRDAGPARRGTRRCWPRRWRTPARAGSRPA